MLRYCFRGVVLVAVVAAILGGLVWAGRLALEHLRGEDRYTISLSEVQCDPPSSMKRDDFLDEVQYLSGLPDKLHLLDEQAPQRLAEAFARHPWVEKVERVQVVSGNTFRIHLHYRIPVLAVPWNGGLRAVDRRGILLPADAATEKLPIYPGIPQPPHGPAGTAWGDPNLLVAVENIGK
jgi:hypothetical protein